MSNKIKELKEAIEKSNMGYVSLIADEDEVILLQRFAKETILLKIKADKDCFVIIESYYYEEDGSTIDDKNIFNSVEEVLNYID